MQIEEIPLHLSPVRSRISDLLENEDPRLSSFFPNGFNPATGLHPRIFELEKRTLLHRELISQYEECGIQLDADDPVKRQIDLLLSENTFTVTAGQQIHAYLGPLFVHHKIRSAIEFCLQFRKDNIRLVPVFWMASEDHDFEEISEIQLFGETYHWKNPDSNNVPVGRRSCEGLVELGDELLQKLGNDEQTASYVRMMQSVYSKSSSFAQATRIILHTLFGEEGLIVLDPDSQALKKMASNVLQQAWKNPGTGILEKNNGILNDLGLKPVISSRDTHLFIIHKGKRERLDRNGDEFILKESGTNLSTDDLEAMDPYFLSPNVAFRPIYQETILPNLVYVSGGTEMVYWLQTKALFDHLQIDFPYVFLRKSAFVVPFKVLRTLSESGLQAKHLFASEAELRNELSSQLLKTIESDLLTWHKIGSDIREFESDFRKSVLFSTEFLDELKKLEKSWHQLDKLLKQKEDQLFQNDSNFLKISKLTNRYGQKNQEREEPLIIHLKFLTALRNPELNYIFTKNRTFSMVFC